MQVVLVDDPRATRLGMRVSPRDEEALLTRELCPDPNHKQSEVLVPLAKRHADRKTAGKPHLVPNIAKKNTRGAP